jgi:hypothetical protein
MLQEERGLILRSKPITFGDGETHDVDLNFLTPALKRMRAPVIRELLLEVIMQGTGTTGDTEGEDAYKFIGRCKVKDRGGVIFDQPGSVMRVIEQLEIGAEVADLAQVTSGGAATDYTHYSRIVFDVEKAHRGADTALPLIHLTEGGEVSITFDTPVNFDVTSGVFRLYAIVHDERVREAKSRMIWKETSISNAEDDYIVKGSLRAAIVTSDLPAAEGYTALSALAGINSHTFQMNDLNPEVLIQEYRRKSGGNLHADDEFTAAARNALPLITPSKGQHIGKMQDLDSFHLKLSAVPASGRMVICVIEDRVPSLAAEWLGYSTTGDFARAVRSAGKVSAKGGRSKAIGSWDPKLQRRLPFTIPRGA